MILIRTFLFSEFCILLSDVGGLICDFLSFLFLYFPFFHKILIFGNLLKFEYVHSFRFITKKYGKSLQWLCNASAMNSKLMTAGLMMIMIVNILVAITESRRAF